MNTPNQVNGKEELSKGRIIDYKAFNFVDGRRAQLLYVPRLYVPLQGCYNVATWSFNAGIPIRQVKKNESWKI